MAAGRILLAIAWAATLLVSGHTASAARNVVLIVADDLGLQVGCYGDRAARTPHIDRLAVEGTRFDRAFCTTSSCSPSRSVILSGLHNHANGQYGLQHASHNFSTRAFVETLPALLKQAGYRTCSIGKVHVQPAELYPFDHFANEGIAGGRNAVRMAENAEAFIRESGSQPFFVYFCPTDPHRAQRGFANEATYPGVAPVKFKPAEVPVPDFLPDRPEVRQELAEYYESIARIDQGVGRLMQALRETGHLEDTLVVFLSDNGPPFPGAKTNLYDAGTRLPLVIRAPDQKQRGVTSEALVSWTDITPTIVEYAGAKPPSYPLHGKSLLGILESTRPAGRDEIYQSHTFHEVTMYYPMRAIRTRKYRYILNVAHPLPFPFAMDLFDSAAWQGVLERGDTQYGGRTVAAYVQRPRDELYDLESDPQETVNLAQRPEHKALVAEMQQKLKSWQTETNDPWLVKYEHE